MPADEDEVIETVRIPLEEALHLLETGQITDAKSALGIVLVRDYLAKLRAETD